MRVGYIAPYQGPDLIKQRPCVRNLSLGGRVKIELISELLRASGHQVEIISQGEVIERQARLFRGFAESQVFHPDVPVRYASALPIRFLNAFWSTRSTMRLLRESHRGNPFDLIFIYNLKPPQVACAEYGLDRLGVPVVLEYEDDQFLALSDGSSSSAFAGLYLTAARRVLGKLSGCLSGSQALLDQVVAGVPRLILCGVVGEDFLKAVGEAGPRSNRVVFSGTHSKAQGLEPLIRGWQMLRPAGWELHIAGHGSETPRLHELAANDRTIVFHGMLDRKANARMLASGRMTVVPYDVTQSRGFSFKTIECLAAGLHVITTPLVALEALDPEMRPGITEIADNRPETIADGLRRVIEGRIYERTAVEPALRRYGPSAVAGSLETFLNAVMSRHAENKKTRK